MPDEEIDKLIRDAAGQHHPPYDDTAWGKMEVLLDKHLPQKKDRKKPIIFLLLFLLVGSAVFFVIQNRGDKNSPAITAAANDNSNGNSTSKSNTPVNNNSNNNPATTNSDLADNTTPGQQQTAVATQPSLKAADNNTGIQPSQKDNSNNIGVVSGEKDVAYANSKAKKHQQKGRVAIKIKKPGVAEDNNGEDNAYISNSDKKGLNNSGKTSVATKAPKATGEEDAVNNTDNNANPADDKADKITAKEDVATVAKDSADKIVKTGKETEKTVTEKDKTGEKTAEKKNNKKFADKFAITLSTGADMSYVSLANAGKVKPVYGAGLSYAVNKHFTVASGVYISKKIYEAKPYQYKFDYTYPSSLVNIKADCNVMEIPVSVYYNFLQSGKHNWLAGVGLSSFFMKKEDYEYQYVYAGGQTYSYYHSVDNENKHYFSVLTLSAGYQYKLNNFISFTAEPYLKLPLGGVGAGKIKLNSTGLLFTASVRPFAKRK